MDADRRKIEEALAHAGEERERKLEQKRHPDRMRR